MSLRSIAALACLQVLLPAAHANEQLRQTVTERAARDTARITVHRETRDALVAEVAAARRRQTGSEASNQQLRAAVAQNLAEVEASRQQLANTTADLADLMAAGRQTAGDLYAVRQRERVVGGSASIDAELGAIAGARRPLTSADLKRTWLLLAEQINAVSGVQRVPYAEGASGQLLQVGAFVAYDDKLHYALRGGRAVPLAPSRESLPAQGEQGFQWVVADATRGDLLTALAAQPKSFAYLKSSGVIGAIILALGAAGAAVVLLRIPLLLAARRRMARQSANDAGGDNPLGRLMLAATGDDARSALDQALQREVAALERGQPLVRLLVAVAPLLGLLGTVTGMIVTFQTLGLYGGSDPALMAGGISRALTTTALGLGVAVPLALALALIRALSNACVQTLEEYAAAHPAQP